MMRSLRHAHTALVGVALVSMVLLGGCSSSVMVDEVSPEAASPAQTEAQTAVDQPATSSPAEAPAQPTQPCPTTADAILEIYVTAFPDARIEPVDVGQAGSLLGVEPGFLPACIFRLDNGSGGQLATEYDLYFPGLDPASASSLLDDASAAGFQLDQAVYDAVNSSEFFVRAYFSSSHSSEDQINITWNNRTIDPDCLQFAVFVSEP